MKHAINALLALSTVMPLAACQKFEASSLGKTLGAQEHSVSVRTDKPWTRVSSKCEKSGKDLTALALQGTAVGFEGQTLQFSQTQLQKIVMVSIPADASHEARTSAYTVTMDQRMAVAADGTVTLSTKVTALDSKVFTDASGLSPRAEDQVGQTGTFEYSATPTQLTLKSASKGACESPTDKIVSVYN